MMAADIYMSSYKCNDPMVKGRHNDAVLTEPCRTLVQNSVHSGSLSDSSELNSLVDERGAPKQILGCRSTLHFFKRCMFDI
jgi:hypothetical protein